MVKLCILTLVTLLLFQVETDAATCCLSYTKHPRRCAVLKGYDIQGITGGCDLAAIIFHTERGRLICADPTQPWTQKRVECLKMKAANVKKISSTNYS
ncbi:C-C motif chemokine 20b [Megalobrama amblycephala]|uniref:C-C motif chemokine 20b n=1 Tax=Megalobrama amblycephala TaxID=75352 RepID=UPI002014332B|nr:C-C motif chemokine 20b [Megalobrama amblycephala]